MQFYQIIKRMLKYNLWLSKNETSLQISSIVCISTPLLHYNYNLHTHYFHFYHLFHSQLSLSIPSQIQLFMYQRGISHQRPTIRPADISMQMLTPMETVLAQGIIQDQQKIIKKQQLQQDYFTAYKPANYQRSLKYKNDHSYQDKNSDGSHRTISFFEDNVIFQKFGPGIYLYLELIRRLGWLFFILSIYELLIVVINWHGTGLNQYSISFGNLLIYSTLGNYSKQVTGYDIYLQTGGHCLINLVFFVFFIFWKVHNYHTIDQYQNGQEIIHPRKYCVQVEGLPPHGVTNRDLQMFFSNFGPVYQCSLVYNYKDKLRFFHDVDQIDQKIKQEELQIALGSGNVNSLKKLKKQKEDLSNQINSIKINPRILSAFIHFQYQGSKRQMVQFYANHYMFSTIFHQCCMHGLCCCCVSQVPNEYRLKDFKLKIKNSKVTDPEQINWDSFDITWCSKISRVLFSFFIILLFMIVCSTLVALCSIFIQTNAVNCSGVQTVNLATAKMTSDTKVVTCFCNSELFSFWDKDVQDVCREVFKTLYIQNLLQIVAAAVSSISNFIFGLILVSIVNFTKPGNLSSSLVTQTLIYFIFIFINSIILPILIYSDLYGIKPASYVSFIKILIPSVDFFNMQSYQYYNDFSPLWYKNVSPFVTNFLVIDVLITWGKFIFYLCFVNCRKSSLQEEQGRILQKKMNDKITSYQVDVVNETAQVFLITFMMMIYCAGIPIVLPLGAICIICRYITNKHMIIHHSKRIDGLTQNFNYLSVVILPLSAILSCFVGIWMLTASSSIYPGKLNIQIPGTTSVQSASFFLPRIFYISFTFVLGALIVVYIFFYNTVVRFLGWMFSCCCQKKQGRIQPVSKPVRFSDATRSMNFLYSYNIHNNDKYKNAILNLQRFLEIE